jgi:hypothetical protein
MAPLPEDESMPDISRIEPFLLTGAATSEVSGPGGPWSTTHAARPPARRRAPRRPLGAPTGGRGPSCSHHAATQVSAADAGTSATAGGGAAEVGEHPEGHQTGEVGTDGSQPEAVPGRIAEAPAQPQDPVVAVRARHPGRRGGQCEQQQGERQRRPRTGRRTAPPWR